MPQNLLRCGLAVLLYLLAGIPVALAGSPQQQLLDTAQGFYSWTIEHGNEVSKLEPRIKDISGTSRFYLDTSTLDAYTARLMQSGYFAPDFPAAVSRYYKRYEAEFSGLGQETFDQLKHDGRGPMMETEDMDPFFCAQEYEYKNDFVSGMKIKSAKWRGQTATATVVSPYQWETKFLFTRVEKRWLISGFCVYK